MLLAFLPGAAPSRWSREPLPDISPQPPPPPAPEHSWLPPAPGGAPPTHEAHGEDGGGGRRRRRKMWGPDASTDDAKRRAPPSRGAAGIYGPAEGYKSAADREREQQQQLQREQRLQRFARASRGPKACFEWSEPGETHGDADEFDMDALTVRGTCTDLEKEYFRLTSAPDPSTVRPEPVLIQSLNHLKQRWKDGGAEYLWICSQLKAVRQDLTVQRIKNALAVDVYETHARIALEEGDLNEVGVTVDDRCLASPLPHTT